MLGATTCGNVSAQCARCVAERSRCEGAHELGAGLGVVGLEGAGAQTGSAMTQNESVRTAIQKSNQSECLSIFSALPPSTPRHCHSKLFSKIGNPSFLMPQGGKSAEEEKK